MKRTGGITKLTAAALIISVLLSMTACGSSSAGQTYMVYFANSSSDDIQHIEYTIVDYQTKDIYSKVSELLYQMFDADYTDDHMYSAKPDSVTVNDYVINSDGVLTVDFSDEYLMLSNVQEIILRSAIVLTVIQVEGISGVSITVNGKPIRYTSGQEIGTMTADDFVNILLNENGMLKQETDVILYFANADGTALIPVTSHLEISNNNASIEEYILGQILAGPETGNGVYPTISSSVELINVVTSDKVCYVNFGQSFLDQDLQPVSDEIMIYSIVNSLCRLSYVNSVQFLVDGETVSALHTVTDISTPFSRNRSLEMELD